MHKKILIDITFSKYFKRQGGTFVVEKNLSQAIVAKYSDAFFMYFNLENLQEIFVKDPSQSDWLKVDFDEFLQTLTEEVSIFTVGPVWISKEWQDQYLTIKRKTVSSLYFFVHDLIPLTHPQWASPAALDKFGVYLDFLSSCASGVFTASDRVLKDIQHQVKGSFPPVWKVGLGVCKPQVSGPPSKRIESITNTPFIVYVSTVEPRKNHRIIYQIYYRLVREFPPERIPKCLLIGRVGWNVEDFLAELTRDELTSRKLLLLDEVTETDLEYLYRKSLFCVYPSLYEGWGLPVAEALIRGKLVVCSDRGSLKEVGKEHPLYIDPWDFIGWKRTFEQLFNDHELIYKHELGIKELYKPISWRDVALNVVNKILVPTKFLIP
jgi:glycosyltransferase involved in cell wall biosynthesis